MLTQAPPMERPTLLGQVALSPVGARAMLVTTPGSEFHWWEAVHTPPIDATTWSAL